MSRKHAVARVHDGLAGIVAGLTVALVAVLVIVVTGSVIARYGFQVGVLWAEEVSRLTFVWVVFLGAYLALRRRAHLSISLLVDRLPAWARLAVRIAGTLLVLSFLGVVVWFGVSLVLQTWRFGRVTAMLGISAAWGYLAVPVAGVLMFVEVLRQAFEPEPAASAEAFAVAAPAAPETAAATDPQGLRSAGSQEG